MLYKIKISKTDYNTLSEVVTLIYTVIFKVVVINNQSYISLTFLTCWIHLSLDIRTCTEVLGRMASPLINDRGLVSSG